MNSQTPSSAAIVRRQIRRREKGRVDVVEFIEICKAVEADPNKLLKVLISNARHSRSDAHGTPVLV